MGKRHTNVKKIHILILVIVLICSIFLYGCPEENSAFVKFTYSTEDGENSSHSIEKIADNWFFVECPQNIGGLNKNELTQNLRQIMTQGNVSEVIPVTTSGYTVAFLVKMR